MASSITVPQLLINEDELNEILRIINSSKDPEAKVVGNLFGLWRNSLIQPVVQLVTGPGKKAGLSRHTFSPDYDYHNEMRKYMEEMHGLLQIGIWCSGSVNRYSRLNQNSPDFNLQTSLLPYKGRHVILLFVECTRGILEIEYHIIDQHQRSLSRVASLTTKDVLPGASCFRLLDPVFDKVNTGAKFPLQRHENTRYFSKSMLHRNDQPRDTITPPRVLRPVQWYESDYGTALMKRLVDGFKAHFVEVEISRDSNSHDVSLKIDRSITLHFPANFPQSGASLSWNATLPRNPDQLCQIILTRTLNILSGETALGLSNGSRL